MSRMFLALVVASIGVFPTMAEEIQLRPIKDNMLYESSSGELGNGAGSFLFAGTTGQFSKNIRRTLLSFDLAAIPDNAAITAAELSLNVSKAASDQAYDFAIHRVLSDWSEGQTDASTGFGEGQGITALDGDATWLHTNKPNGFWGLPGGDFVEVASDTIPIGGENRYVWGMTGNLVDDIQFWLKGPAENFGWIVMGDESEARTAKRFDSRTNPNESTRPLLTITYESVSLRGDCNDDGILDFQDVRCACTSVDFSIEQVLAETHFLAGDIDGDHEVGFADFLVLSSNFNAAGTYTSGDLNCDGNIGFADFLILSSNFGLTLEASLATVPEPSVTVLVPAIAFLLRLRRLFSHTGPDRTHPRPERRERL